MSDKKRSLPPDIREYIDRRIGIALRRKAEAEIRKEVDKVELEEGIPLYVKVIFVLTVIGIGLSLFLLAIFLRKIL